MAKISAKEIFFFAKLLRIDLFFFFATLSTSLPNLALNQLIQDKFCINKYLLNETDCLNLEKSSSDFETIQSEVLKETTSLKLYITLVTTVPSIFLSLIMGYWVDKYPSHLRYLLGVAAMANVCANIMVIYQCIYFEMDPYLLLLTYLVPVLTGSTTLVSVGTYTYATRKTPAKYRSIRFTVLELFLFATIPIANLAGGGIVASKPWFANQLRNYIGVYIVSSVCAIFAAIWVAIFLYDSVDETKSKESDKVDETSSLNAKGSKKSLKRIIYDVIKPNNILIATRCVFKKRPNNAHWFLVSNIVAGFLANIGYLAEQNIGYQFSQRVYHWSASQIGLFNSVIIVFPAAGIIIGPPLFIHKMRLHETAVAIIGISSLIVAYLFKGFILSPVAFFLAVFCCFAGLIFIVDRSITSRLIHADEVGQVYAFTAVIGSFNPVISSLFYTEIFQATVDFNPGLVYIFGAMLFIYPLVNAIWLNINKHKWDLVLIGEMQNSDNETINN